MSLKNGRRFPLIGDTGGPAILRSNRSPSSCAPDHTGFQFQLPGARGAGNARRQRKARRAVKRAGLISMQQRPAQEAAARGARLRELRWKNSAWLATAETIAGWNGFEIRNAGSGRSPVRKRSG